MKFVVIKEVLNGITGEDEQSYIGIPFKTERQAQSAAVADFYATHYIREHHKMEVFYFENETQLRFVSEETGEIFADYFILAVFF